jgi:hypothetical protein
MLVTVINTTINVVLINFMSILSEIVRLILETTFD